MCLLCCYTFSACLPQASPGVRQPAEVLQGSELSTNFPQYTAPVALRVRAGMSWKLASLMHVAWPVGACQESREPGNWQQDWHAAANKALAAQQSKCPLGSLVGIQVRRQLAQREEKELQAGSKAARWPSLGQRCRPP